MTAPLHAFDAMMRSMLGGGGTLDPDTSLSMW
eukprot:CAMPEP_0114171822 /NCGR_PEP_ID=MMETSP0043_2-20121206/34910_1 /TAXON_ID=464988 /ORGANISM="Hemiselmis andersenii, Strain CCMP644" /LENGTH=31 /DNA_ID= /DNA_START= /DNA_END= /DNA_ORIENTATION=